MLLSSRNLQAIRSLSSPTSSFSCLSSKADGFCKVLVPTAPLVHSRHNFLWHCSMWRRAAANCCGFTVSGEVAACENPLQGDQIRHQRVLSSQIWAATTAPEASYSLNFWPTLVMYASGGTSPPGAPPRGGRVPTIFSGMEGFVYGVTNPCRRGDLQYGAVKPSAKM